MAERAWSGEPRKARIAQRGLRPQPKSMEHEEAEAAEMRAGRCRSVTLCFLCYLLFKYLRKPQKLGPLVARMGQAAGGIREIRLIRGGRVFVLLHPWVRQTDVARLSIASVP